MPVTVKSPVKVSVVFNKNGPVPEFKAAISAAIEALGATKAPEISVAICDDEDNIPSASSNFAAESCVNSPVAVS